MEGPNKHFYLLITTFIVAIIGIGQLFTKTFPLLFANAINFCQQSLSNVIITFPSSLSIILISLIVFVIFLGIITIGIQVLKTRWYINKHLNQQVSVNSKLQRVFKSLRLDNRVDLVQDPSALSFSYGLFKPRICISIGLVQKLSRVELKAVLLHESYHIHNFDPLKIVLSKTASMMFFFLPIIYDFQKNYALSKEIAADRVAVIAGQRESLLTVLAKLLTMTFSVRLSSVAALADIDTLEERILVLTEQKKETTIGFSTKRLGISLITAFVGLLILITPIHALANSNMEMSGMNIFYFCPFKDRCFLSSKKQFNTIPNNMTVLFSSLAQ